MQVMQAIIAYPKIKVIRLDGSFNASKAVEFKLQLTTAITPEGHANVLVDLEQVESLDSAGLMLLVDGLRLTQTLERRFGLCSIPPSIQIIFELTQLDQVFEIFENIAAFENTMLQV